MRHSPRVVATIAALFIAITFGASLARSAEGPACNPNRPATPELAIKALLDGSGRWASGKQQHPGEDSARRECLFKNGQTPFAAILSCSDSRVPPDLVFDQGPGDLFVARVAGNSTDDLVVQSLDYAVEHLHAEAILVLGHQECGAVKAAVESYPKSAPDFVSVIYRAVATAKDIIKRRGGDPDDKAAVAKETIDQHVVLEVLNLRGRQPFKKLVQRRKLKIVGGRYDLDTGQVEMVIE